MKKYSFYIFDFDNTLFDTSEGMKLCYQKALEELGIIFDEKLLGEFIRESLKDTFSRYENDELKFKKFERTFLEVSKEYMCVNSKPFNDTLEVLRTIHKSNIKMAIVSGKPTERITEILEKYGIKDYFIRIVGYGDYLKDKPNPESLNVCINNINISKEEIVYIGDSLFDMQAARNCGIDGLLIKRNINVIKSDIGYSPVINSLSEIINEYKICLSTVGHIQYDLLKLSIEEIKDIIVNISYFNDWCLNLDKHDEGFIKLTLGNNECLYIFSHGIFVRSKIFSNTLENDIIKIIEEKNRISNQLLQDNSDIYSLIEILNNNLEQWIKGKHIRLHHVKSKLFTDSKVGYNLACYKVQTLFKNTESMINNIIGLILKRKYKGSTDTLVSELITNSIHHAELSEDEIFAAIWGARVFISDGKTSEKFHDYIEYEARIQNAWYLISKMNNTVDWFFVNHKKKLNQKMDLLDMIYNVLYANSTFKYINATISHRYQLEIMRILYNVSNLETLLDYLKTKSELLTQKIDLSIQKKGNKNAKTINTILFILTLVSTVSAIFQIVNYWMTNEGTLNTYSLNASIILIACAGLVFLVYKVIYKILR